MGNPHALGLGESNWRGSPQTRLTPITCAWDNNISIGKLPSALTTFRLLVRMHDHWVIAESMERGYLLKLRWQYFYIGSSIFMDNVALARMSCEHASPWMAFILIGSSSSRPRAPLIFDAAISSRVNNASSKFRDSFAGFVPEASERPSNLFSPQNHTRDRGLFLFPNQKPCE